MRMLHTMASDKAGAFETAVRRHERELLSFAFRMTGAEEAARDVVQDALLKAHVALRAGSEPADFRPWLYRLTYNAACDLLRRHAVEQRATSRLSHEGRSAVQGGDRDMERLLALLPAEHRTIVILRYVSGFSFAEMADVLGRPAATLCVYAARALEMLHARLREAP